MSDGAPTGLTPHELQNQASWDADSDAYQSQDGDNRDPAEHPSRALRPIVTLGRAVGHPDPGRRLDALGGPVTDGVLVSHLLHCAPVGAPCAGNRDLRCH